MEGHGRTADLDRPLSYEQMAEDVAALLGRLAIKQADVFGFSLGGATALRLAIRHPDLVRKLVTVSASYNNEGFYPSIVAGWPYMSAQAYAQTAPNPKHWPVFVENVKHALIDFRGWPAADIQSIKAPTLLMLGNSDLIRPEYAVGMFRLPGGGTADGDKGGIASSQLAVLPGTTHFNILYRTDLLLPIVQPFFDAPIPESS
jgi:pimeloyl-ACP methyl ester carboxylesterase